MSRILGREKSSFELGKQSHDACSRRQSFRQCSTIVALCGRFAHHKVASRRCKSKATYMSIAFELGSDTTDSTDMTSMRIKNSHLYSLILSELSTVSRLHLKFNFRKCLAGVGSVYKGQSSRITNVLATVSTCTRRLSDKTNRNRGEK